MVGGPWPTEWKESIVIDSETNETFDVGVTDQHVIRVGTPLQRRVEQRNGPRGDGHFELQLANRMMNLFQATIKEGKKAGPVPFDFAVVPAGSVDRPEPSASDIGSRDLLCFVCTSRNSSIIRRFNREGFEESLSRNPGAAGMTSNLEDGVCSEVWLQDCGFEIRAVQNAIYHEWMHNKTRFAAGENPEWVHTTGGGDVAAARAALSIVALNQINARKMGSRLHIANRQFTRGLAIL
jgi:hypothetical protein